MSSITTDTSNEDYLARLGTLRVLPPEIRLQIYREYVFSIREALPQRRYTVWERSPVANVSRKRTRNGLEKKQEGNRKPYYKVAAPLAPLKMSPWRTLSLVSVPIAREYDSVMRLRTQYSFELTAAHVSTQAKMEALLSNDLLPIWARTVSFWIDLASFTERKVGADKVNRMSQMELNIDALLAFIRQFKTADRMCVYLKETAPVPLAAYRDPNVPNIRFPISRPSGPSDEQWDDEYLLLKSWERLESGLLSFLSSGTMPQVKYIKTLGWEDLCWNDEIKQIQAAADYSRDCARNKYIMRTTDDKKNEILALMRQKKAKQEKA